MLRLQKLEMLGFKSFFSRTEFHFDRDITAVVGPNGCGKSNIGDALNWVIGEQSVKSLRGDRMEDVIFNGSEGRKPLGMAEVSLHLKNGNGDGLEEQIVITRRLFRSGDSEYLLNGEKKRLRDVQEVLARINIGSGVYSIIEQGKVDAVLSTKPKDRRQLIEEAAGIAIYKTRKRQAEAKLEATEANLARVNDIISEIERQLRSLRRQAARARRFNRTSDEIERRERILFCHDRNRLGAEREAVAAREAEARRIEEEAAAKVSRLEALHEEQQRRLADEDIEWRRRRDELHQLDRDLDRHERDIAQAREQSREAAAAAEAADRGAAELAGRLSSLAARIEARGKDREAIDRQVAAEDQDKERLAGRREEVDERVAVLERDLADARASFLQIVDTLSEARNISRAAEERLERLGRRRGALEREEFEAQQETDTLTAQRKEQEQLLASMEEETARTRADLEGGTRRKELIETDLVNGTAGRDECGRRLHGCEERLRALEEIEQSRAQSRELLSEIASHEGFLADGLKVEAGLEAAVDRYLSDLLDAALVRDTGSAVAGIAALKRKGRGRAWFLPIQSEPAPMHEGGSPLVGLPAEVRSDEGFVGRLSERLTTDASRAGALRGVLARALIVRDLDAAMRMRRKAPFFDYISLEGDIVHTSGLIEGGPPRADGAGILGRQKARADLLMSIESDRTKLAEWDSKLERMNREKASASASLADLAAALTEKEKQVVSLRHRVETAREDEGRARARIDTIHSEKRQAGDESTEVREERDRVSSELVELEEKRAALESSISRLQEEVAEKRESSARIAEDLSAVRADLSASRQRLEAVDADLAQLLESDQELRDRLERERERAAGMERRIAEASRLETDSAAALREKGEKRSDLSEMVHKGEVLLSEKRIAGEEMAQQVRAARGELEECRARREQATLEKERVAADLRHLEESARGESEATIEDLIASVTPEEMNLDPGTLREELAQLRMKKDRIGPINMMALDQFRELEERFDFLGAQRNDLTGSIASLKETIARINRTSRERFLDAFERTRVEFNELFRILFGGGKADLTLLTEDGSDVLECGIEVNAQPPGKRLQRVTLLSGGEKALTAIAMLFAIFRYKPSPFCLLDEVDAALDEANVIRFSDLLKTMSDKTQFVLITHNRGSMETADVLYGITMEEPGVSRTMSVELDGSRDRAEAVRSLPEELRSRHRGSQAQLRGSTGSNGGNGPAPVPPAG